MVLRGIISPPRFRSSPREGRSHNNATINPPSKPTSKKPNNHNNPNRSQRKETQLTATRPTKSNNVNTSSKNTSRINPSTKPTSKLVSSNPSHKKLENNSTTKIHPSKQTRPTSSKSNVKGEIAIGSGSRSELSSAGKPTAIAKDKYFDSRYGSPNPYSPAQFATLHDLDVLDQLQRFSIDGKDLASIVLHESMGSDTKEESYSQSNDSRMFQIYKEIASHRQENSSITSYFTKLEALWNELATFNTDLPQCSCGGVTEKLSEYMERERVMQFLVGLNDSYSKMCNQILITPPFPTVEKAYYAIIREEKRRELLAALETVAEKVIQNNWLDLQNQNAHSNNGDNYDGVQGLVDSNNLHQHQFDQNLVTSFPIDPLLTDLGSPVRC